MWKEFQGKWRCSPLNPRAILTRVNWENWSYFVFLNCSLIKKMLELWKSEGENKKIGFYQTWLTKIFSLKIYSVVLLYLLACLATEKLPSTAFFYIIPKSMSPRPDRLFFFFFSFKLWALSDPKSVSWPPVRSLVAHSRVGPYSSSPGSNFHQVA